MAIYHLSVKVISRADGKSVTRAAAYRAGARIKDLMTGEVHDFSRKRGVDWSGVIAPAGAPDWARDRESLWNAVESVERRKDAQLAREVEIALPRELAAEAKIKLVSDFVQRQFVDVGMVADIAIHHIDGQNPHAHILLTTRRIDGDGFGAKDRSWNDRSLLLKWRKSWADAVNTELSRAGCASRIDHRSLADQGIDRPPTRHLGPIAHARLKRKRDSRRALDIESDTRSLDRLKIAKSPKDEEAIRRLAEELARAKKIKAAAEDFARRYSPASILLLADSMSREHEMQPAAKVERPKKKGWWSRLFSRDDTDAAKPDMATPAIDVDLLRAVQIAQEIAAEKITVSDWSSDTVAVSQKRARSGPAPADRHYQHDQHADDDDDGDYDRPAG